MASDQSSYGKRLSSLRWGIFLSVILLLVFVAFTWTVTWFDVQDIGVNGSSVGYATLNGAIHSMFPSDAGCYEVSETLGHICILVAAVNSFLALVDFIKGHGFRGMHKRYLLTLLLYAVVVVLYIAFSLIPINTRPNSYEQSYPSSHCMLALCVLYSQIVLLGYGAERNRDWVEIFDIMIIIVMVSMVVFRLLSGVHWFTDIVGAMLLSFALMVLYRTLIRFLDYPKRG